MKLTRLDSTTARPSGEAAARAQAAAPERVRRVEAMEGVEGDRQRSLRQELAEIDPRAVGPFAGQAQVMSDARIIAEQLARLDSAANLVRGTAIPDFVRDQVDAKA